MPRRIPAIDYSAHRPRRVVRSFDELPAILDVSDIAIVLNVCTETVLRMCQKGKLPAFKAGTKWRMRKERLVEHIKQLEASGM